jgi:hypothetical protein
MTQDQYFPHVNPKEFDTQLAAVWFAANYYYKESYLRGGETTGVLFKRPNGKHSFTVRQEGGFKSAAVKWSDVPKNQGFEITGAWHTHIPGSRFCQLNSVGAGIACVAFTLTDSLLGEFRTFSPEDRTDVADRATRVLGRPIPFYLLTADMIKRYTPGQPDKTWRKAIPSKMEGLWLEKF